VSVTTGDGLPAASRMWPGRTSTCRTTTFVADTRPPSVVSCGVVPCERSQAERFRLQAQYTSETDENGRWAWDTRLAFCGSSSSYVKTGAGAPSRERAAFHNALVDV
jgi:hypothetical protein